MGWEEVASDRKAKWASTGWSERWRERTQVGRFPGQGDEQMCVYARVSECMLVCVHSHVCMSIFLTY